MIYNFNQSGKIKRFPLKSGWYYIDITEKEIPAMAAKIKWGLIPSYFSIKDFKWKASILPKGKGKYFIALSKKVREKFNLELGDKVTINVEVI